MKQTTEILNSYAWNLYLHQCLVIYEYHKVLEGEQWQSHLCSDLCTTDTLSGELWLHWQWNKMESWKKKGSTLPKMSSNYSNLLCIFDSSIWKCTQEVSGEEMETMEWWLILIQTTIEIFRFYTWIWPLASSAGCFWAPNPNTGVEKTKNGCREQREIGQKPVRTPGLSAPGWALTLQTWVEI